MSSRREGHWAATSARVTVGAALGAAAVVGAVVAVAAPWPQVQAAPVRIEATPEPSDTVLACDGPLLALGRTVEQAGTYSVAQEQAVVSGPAAIPTEAMPLAAPGGAVPLALRAAPVDGRPAPLAAAGAAQVDSPDLRGLAASSCRPALRESWLVAGASTTGSNDLVVLSNPGAVPATVDLTVFSAAGAQNPPGGSQLVVPARAQAVVPLAGLVLGEESPVVRVTAAGAPVRASLQTSLTRVITAGGVDQVAAVPAATATQVIPGVQVTPPAGEPGASEPGTLVRVLSPAADTTATVRVVPTAGADAPSPEPFDLPLVAGVPSELDLSSVAGGTYTVTVEADAPVVAAVWQSTGVTEGSDFAWSASAPALSASAVVAVPNAAEPELTLANAGGQPVTVTLEPVNDQAAIGSGAWELPAGLSVSVPVAPGGIYRILPGGPVHAAVTLAAEGALAAYPVWPADAAARPVIVYP